MKSTLAVSAAALLVSASMASAASVWDPAYDGVFPPDVGNWNEDILWTQGVPTDTGSDETGKAVFNVFDAAEAQVTDEQTFWKLVQGDGGDGGVIRVMDGGSLTMTDDQWSSIGYNSDAHMIVETGGTVNFGGHAWVGFLPGAFEPVKLDISGGVVNVTNVFGINFEGGDAIVNITDGGMLNVPGRADIGKVDGLGTINVNSGGVFDLRHLINDGAIVVGDGGRVTTATDQWSSIGDEQTTGSLTVETGGVVEFGQHLWVGKDPGSVGTIDIDGGVVNVGNGVDNDSGMLGLGWSGGTGFINVNDGGLLNLSNIHGDGSRSISEGSLLSINGSGEVTLPGDFEGVIATYAENGLIAGNGVVGAVQTTLEPVPGGPGDFDENGQVDGQDFLAWQRDASVGDLADWEANFGGAGGVKTIITAVPLAAIGGVPEPSAWALMLAGASVLFGLRRRVGS